MVNQKLKNEVWDKESYYDLAAKASIDTDHPGMKLLLKYSTDAKKILDLGCGEGTRLNLISKNTKESVGVDISQLAIKKARQKFPKIKFINGDLESLQLKDSYFDLVFSAYVLEHLNNPQMVIEEAIRVTKNEGKIIFIAPNYGAPNRSSPPFKGSRIKKIIQGLIVDLSKFKSANKLDWNKVDPIATSSNYDIDWDTTIEPYLKTLIDYMKSKNLKILEFNGCWDYELSNASILQRCFKLLAKLGIYPFIFWGPHFVIVSEKY